MVITQSEYDHLMRIKKNFTSLDDIVLGPHPIRWKREIIGAGKENFQIDFIRNSFILEKFTINKSYRKSIVMLRYDEYGRHTNPGEFGGQTFDGPHVHIYRENFEDKVAFSVSQIGVNASSDSLDTIFSKFLKYCNIEYTGNIQLTLI